MSFQQVVHPHFLQTGSYIQKLGELQRLGFSSVFGKNVPEVLIRVSYHMKTHTRGVWTALWFSGGLMASGMGGWSTHHKFYQLFT